MLQVLVAAMMLQWGAFAQNSQEIVFTDQVTVATASDGEEIPPHHLDQIFKEASKAWEIPAEELRMAYEDGAMIIVRMEPNFYEASYGGGVINVLIETE